MVDYGGWLWVAIGIGVILLGIVLTVAMLRWRARRDSATQKVRDQATRRVYEAEQHGRPVEAQAQPAPGRVGPRHVPR
ncbi:MAG: hypothetical protein R3D62_10365 [Xanthobacteraceae bacterium]